jgi:hypothetical protein
MAQPVIVDGGLGTLEDEFSVGLDKQGRIRISPTDVSKFIRLDQCALPAAPSPRAIRRLPVHV